VQLPLQRQTPSRGFSRALKSGATNAKDPVFNHILQRTNCDFSA